MRYFFSIGFIFLCFVAGMQGIALEGTSHSYDPKGGSASEEGYILSPALENFSYMSTEENGSDNVLSAISIFLRSHFTGITFNKDCKALTDCEISHYIFYSECQITRFEGIKIIYPFGYFW